MDKAIEGGLSQDMTLLEGQRYITPGMYDSGLRQGEIPKLTYKEIDFGKKVMLVHGKGDKERLVPFEGVQYA